MEEEARVSRAAWAQSMDACDQETDGDFRSAESRPSETETVSGGTKDSEEPQDSDDRASETAGTWDLLRILQSQSYQRRPVAVLRLGYDCSYCTPTKYYEYISASMALENGTNNGETRGSTASQPQLPYQSQDPTTTTSVTSAQLQAMIDQGVTAVLAARQEGVELALLCDRMFPEETDKIERQGFVPAGNDDKKPYEGINLLCHFKKDCPQWKNKNQGNGNAVAKAYAVGVAGQNPNNNVVTGTFLLNNRCASILFDTGADRSFVSTQFGTLINITPTTLDHGYNVELADGRIIWVNTVLLGCTLNFSLNIRVTFEPNACRNGILLTSYLDGLVGEIPKPTRFTSSRQQDPQKYLLKWMYVFLEHITIKETGDKSKKKQLQDVPVVKNFPEVFPEDLPGSSPIEGSRRRSSRTPHSELEYGHYEFTLCRLSKQEHEEHLKIILELLKKEELYAKFSKCEFWIPKVQFLGHVIDNKGIHVDPAKIESVKDWASPKTPTEIRQFLGLAGYYQRFIEVFQRLAKPMTKPY
ncbi:putative reverse transcriptase domain-containing protein [Tanacetum coccineum]|uniref:Reverse transcriptase domain-containing protein n=1 Tax=Tanacetum coccineum TaxID=301880 RepID=A0ABQ5GH16_9ASTR